MSCVAFSLQEQPESRWRNHPSSRGLTPESGNRLTLCPLDWPPTISLLRLWHKDLQQFVDQLNQQLNHRHMFSRWDINYDSLRVESSITNSILMALVFGFRGPPARCSLASMWFNYKDERRLALEPFDARWTCILWGRVSFCIGFFAYDTCMSMWLDYHAHIYVYSLLFS